MTDLLVVDDLHAAVEGTEILKGVNLTVAPGETHAIMGPNGSGKSTLANVLLGHPGYLVTSGTVTYKGEDITKLTPEKRGQAGMFLGFQYPQEIPGVSVVNFLRTALSNRTGTDLTVLELRLKVMDALKDLDMDPAFADRYLNEGFSGGERKRNEILQMAVLEPDLAILDETDSGLDIDALKIVAEGIDRLRNVERGIVIITHYQRMLDYITPDIVHVMLD
ncbi:MAG: Fe-S cluster assembly ATPase SufC, partial [Actinobacteria bacterium]|nr:Fe-S cluster assembly ATPase SufC [Actinomycetota bacterium]